jgi:hypothetical protein
MNPITTLSAHQLRQAADLTERIQELQAKLGKILGGEVQAAQAPGRKKISAAGIARIKAAQKARWAKIKAKAAKPVKKAKRRMSAAGRAALRAAAKARWAKVKAAGRKKL